MPGMESRVRGYIVESIVVFSLFPSFTLPITYISINIKLIATLAEEIIVELLIGLVKVVQHHNDGKGVTMTTLDADILSGYQHRLKSHLLTPYEHNVLAVSGLGLVPSGQHPLELGRKSFPEKRF